jgi:hypothetical protein
MCSTAHVVRVIIRTAIRLEGLVRRVEWKRYTLRILVGKAEGSTRLRAPRLRWENTVKMGLNGGEL